MIVEIKASRKHTGTNFDYACWGTFIIKRSQTTTRKFKTSIIHCFNPEISKIETLCALNCVNYNTAFKSDSNEEILIVIGNFFTEKGILKSRTLNNKNQAGKVIHLFKNLNTMVIIIGDNYFTITKDCCRNWDIELSCPCTTYSKLSYKLSAEFKNLHSVIK